MLHRSILKGPLPFSLSSYRLVTAWTRPYSSPSVTTAATSTVAKVETEASNSQLIFPLNADATQLTNSRSSSDVKENRPHAELWQTIDYQPLRLPALQPMATTEAGEHVEKYYKHLQDHRQATQKALREQLASLVEKNQAVREWTRLNAHSNGSMRPRDQFHPLPQGVGGVHVHAGQNNTIITLTDWRHRVIKTVSGGVCGLKGCHRGTPESGVRTATRIANLATQKQLNQVIVYLKGYGVGRESAFRTLLACGLNILKVVDATPLPHGGCRPRKKRRV